MPYYEFEKHDLFDNTIELNPDCNFFIYGLKAYYKNLDQIIGNSNTPSGHINLFELNVNRATNNLIYPFLPKGSSLENFRSISTSEYNALDPGTLLTGSYPLTASITTEVYDTSATRTHIDALKNVLNYYNYKSQHYAFSSSLGNKGTQRLTLIDLPSIFYGSKIKKGSVDLRFYLSGSLLGQLTDKNRNGELFQSSGSISANNDKVAGVVLYNEGLIVLTGSWDLNTLHTAKYVDDGGSAIAPRWNAFGRKTEETVSSSYSVNYHEPSGVKLVNTISSSYANYSEKFQKQTFISKIGIYDENRNLIAIAKLAQPVRKREKDNYTFKLKLDY